MTGTVLKKHGFVGWWLNELDSTRGKCVDMTLWDFALRSIRVEEARFDPSWLLSTSATSTTAVDLERANCGTRMIVNPSATTERGLFVLACGSTPSLGAVWRNFVYDDGLIEDSGLVF
jgi:hypothetical protein